jgi:hypothetical protein
VVGDIVKLKSGGPKMTIVAITATVAACRWFQEPDVQIGPMGSTTGGWGDLQGAEFWLTSLALAG